jgi:O-antigen/teichoic acid export membrane protein
MSDQSTDAVQPASFRRGVFLTSFGTIVTIGLFFLETIIAARVLPKESYGIYVLLIALVNFLIVAVDCGCQTGVTQLLASSERTRQEALANSALVFRIAVLAVVGVGIWLAHGLLNLADPSQTLARYVVYVPAMLAVASLDELLLSMLRGFHAYRHWTTAQIVRSILRVVLTSFLLLVMKLDLLALIYSWIISFAASVAYEYMALPISRRLIFRRPLIGEILRFGFPIQLTRFLWYAFLQADVLLLGLLAGPASVAYYAVARKIPDGLQRLSESYIAVYFPAVTTLFATGRHDRASAMLNRSLRLISFLSALVAIVGVAFSQPIMLLFSQKYLDSAPAFGLLMMALHITFIASLLGYTMTAAGHPGRSLAENITRTGLNVLGDLLLIPPLGFVGPALATLLAAYASNPLLVWLLRRKGVVVAVAPYAKQTLLLLLCSAIFWWLQPAAIAIRLGIVALFVALNLLLATISRDDLALVLPERLLPRPVAPAETLPRSQP